MLKLDEFYNFAEPLFAQACGAFDPELPVHWPNAPFTMPNDRVWVAFTYLKEERFQRTLGKKVTMCHVGGIQVDVVAPKESGRRDAGRTADAVFLPFDAKQYRIAFEHTILFKRAEVDVFDDDDGRYRIMLRAAYTRDVTLSLGRSAA